MPQGAGVVSGRPNPAVPTRLTQLLESMLSRGALTPVFAPSGAATRPSRVVMYLGLLREAATRFPPSDGKTALAIVNDALNAVENRFSGLPYEPTGADFRSDGRMYPILDDLPRGPASAWIELPVAVRLEQSAAERYQTKSNDVLIGANGAIEIWLSAGLHPSTGAWTPARCVLRLPGASGLSVTRELL